MRTLFPSALAAALVLCVSPCVTTDSSINAATVYRTRKKMKPFSSNRELERYLREAAEKYRRARAGQVQNVVMVSSAETVMVSSSQGPDESVTNTQHAGVDEGGIVKLHGNHLVILRRGRLFTVAIGNGALHPVSSIDAFGPEIDPNKAWYDEMLISGDTIAVIGYSYERKGTEVGLFNVDAQGQLSYRSTYTLRSNDYYSSRNYASRLIGSKLIFYNGLYLNPDSYDPFESFPAVRKWHKEATDDDFRRILSYSRVYRPATDFGVQDGLTLHTVTTCDLARGFDCQATTVVGPSGNVFYVSPDSVYVWAVSWERYNTHRGPSFLFRMPLDGSGPSALRVTGGPVDQFSFLQSEDQHLNVLVRAGSKGDGMWGAEVSEGDVALMRIPLWSFSDGSETVPASSYTQLPKPGGYNFQNRFVGDHLLYGTGGSWEYQQSLDEWKRVYVVEWARGNWHRVALPHAVDRIEQMGSNAVVVGSEGKDLHFSALRLGPRPEIAAAYVRPGASQGETRSHGFFYKPDGNESGTLGLPFSVPAGPKYKHLFETSAAILFLRNEALELREVGELTAQIDKAVADKCRASCVDWYGNARPLFLRGRVFALLGYELVEGKVADGRLTEVRRINYAPR